MNIVPYLRKLRALLEVLWVVVRVVADVLCRAAAQERMLNAGAVRSMEVDELLMYPLLLKEV